MTHYAPKYISPKKAAQERAQLRRRLIWLGAGLAVAFALMVIGYSDQAPLLLREATSAVDRMLGYPVLSLIAAVMAR
jgi:hypothetical protein